MAVLWASRATDMRDDLNRGIPVDFGRSEITLATPGGTTTFEGVFTFPGLGTLDPFTYGYGFEPFVPHPLAVEGTLTGFGQARGTATFQVEGLDLDARAAFFVLFRLGDTDGFLRLAFAGNDVLSGSRSRDVLNGYAGNDNLWGYGGNDCLKGGAGSDTLYGVDGRDSLSGGSGRDWLWGGDDDDRLSGGSGSDRLSGDDGDDRLTGGRGQDVLEGGDGDDTFRYLGAADSRPGSSRRDTIRDLGDGDLVDLRAIDANSTQRGNQRFTWIGDDAFDDVAGQLRFDEDSRLLQGDTNGDGRADFEVRLSGSFVPDADSFLL